MGKSPRITDPGNSHPVIEADDAEDLPPVPTEAEAEIIRHAEWKYGHDEGHKAAMALAGDAGSVTGRF